MTTPETHPRASLPVKSRSNVPLLLVASRAVCTAMAAASARFPTPIPGLAGVLAQIGTLDLAQQAMGTGKAATAARNAARTVLWGSMLGLRTYVQGIADASPSADAVTIIKSAGFDVARAPSHTKAVLSAKLTASGTVKLSANAKVLTGGSKKRSFFNWQYSVDGGHTWVTAPSTGTGTTTLTGLPVMTTVSFRVSVTLVATEGPWSQVITLPIH